MPAVTPLLLAELWVSPDAWLWLSVWALPVLEPSDIEELVPCEVELAWDSPVLLVTESATPWLVLSAQD